MAAKPTKKQKDYILKAEYEYSILKKPLPECPECGKPLVIEQLGNGARTIRCEDESCIFLTIRGL